MGNFGWSYPAGCTGTPYDDDHPCSVCGTEAGSCDCPECPRCGVQGDPDCYSYCGLEPQHDSIKSLCDHLGVSPVAAALRAVAKYNAETIWLVLPEGLGRIFYSDYAKLTNLPAWLRLTKVGVGGVQDDSWEWNHEVPAGNGWTALDDARQAFNDARTEHTLAIPTEQPEETPGDSLATLLEEIIRLVHHADSDDRSLRGDNMQEYLGWKARAEKALKATQNKKHRKDT